MKCFINPVYKTTEDGFPAILKVISDNFWNSFIKQMFHESDVLRKSKMQLLLLKPNF